MVAGAPMLASDACQHEVERLIRQRAQMPPEAPVLRPVFYWPTPAATARVGAGTGASTAKPSRSSSPNLGKAAVAVVLLAQVATLALVMAPSESPTMTSAAIERHMAPAVANPSAYL